MTHRGVRAWLGSLRPDRGTLGTDAVAGVPGAIGSVPDGMAAAVLVGVNPVYGLYASIAGPIAGGLTASTQRMVITTTTAAALAAGSAVSGFSGADRSDALFLLTILAGALMVAAGLLRLGRYTRFVSVSVLTGFLTGVAFNIIFGQLGDLLGAPAEGSFSLARAWDVVTHPGAISWTSAAVGLSALVLMIGLSRTRVATFASVIALIVPTLISLGLSGIARVEDVGDIPTGIPMPHLPALSLLTSLNLLVGAAAITIIVLVQGTGVAESAPNRDGSLTNPDRDFLAQGIGNIAAGLFRGQPVGGSVGQSALNIAAGARSRWAAIFSGIWMLLIVVVFSGVVGKIAIPTLAAVLIFAAASSLRTGRIDTIVRTGTTSRIAFVTTLLATLVLPVAAAVGIGVSLSLLLQLGQEAEDLTVMRAQLGDDDRFVEQPAPAKLPSDDVTLLHIYGSLQFAGARTLQVLLPDPAGATRPVVILRLRGRTRLGATSFIVLADYAERIRAAGGHLFLSGVDPALTGQLIRTRRVDLQDAVTVLQASATVGDSTREAYAQARAWLAAAADARPGES